jgi:hypothetical protein
VPSASWLGSLTAVLSDAVGEVVADADDVLAAGFDRGADDA